MNSLRSWFNSPMKRMWRLGWLAVAYLLLALLISSAFAPALDGDLLFWPVTILFACIVSRVSSSTGGLIFKPNKLLDERQRALRNKAYRLSHQIMSVLGLLLIFPSVLIRNSVEGLPSLLSMQDPVQAVQVMVSVLTIYVLLQFALVDTMIAWLEPDPIKEETSVAPRRTASEER